MHQTIHRHSFPFREAMAALLGDDQIDAESYEIRVIGNAVVVDLVNPVTSTRAEDPAPDGDPAPSRDEEKKEDDLDASRLRPGELGSELRSEPMSEDSDGMTKEPEPPRKGGPLAKQAGIICGERAFWTYMNCASEEDAAAALRDHCGVESRVDLDFDEYCGRRFRELKVEYENWLKE